MSGKSHHVVPALNGGWNVVKSGAKRATRHFDNQEDAIAWGRELSKKQGKVFIIHKRDGTIAKKAYYGSDPCTPSDRDTNL